MNRATRAALIGTCAIAAVAAAVVGYAYREQLRSVPVVGGLLGRTPPTAELFVCPMHPEVVSDKPGRTCPTCGMDLVKASDLPSGGDDGTEKGESPGSSDARGATPRASFSLDLRRQQLIGVRLATAERTTIERQVRAVGTVQFDETRLADINVRVEGFVRELFVDSTGQYVGRGQPLFTLYSPELRATEEEYLLALRARDTMEPAAGDDARGYADRLAAAARQRLALWELPAEEIDRLERTRTPLDTVTFRSPASGHVIEKKVVQGQRVTPGESLYRLADLGTVWVEADVYQRDLSSVKLGQSGTITLDTWPNERFTARVSLVLPSLDAASRTARVRLVLRNPGARLRPGMFANVELAAPRREVLAVPGDAVVDSGTRQFVFVSQGDGYFQPRQVETGTRTDQLVEIRRGLDAGQQVASGATFFIDSESQLRAAMEGFEAVPDLAAGASARQGEALAVEFRTDPDPPRNGDNGFEVRVRNADGTPVSDATVSVRLFMAPMPSMNMPAMRTDLALLHVEAGTYRGRGNVSMAGRWDVTVTVTRAGQHLGSRMFAITAR